MHVSFDSTIQLLEMYLKDMQAKEMKQCMHSSLHCNTVIAKYQKHKCPINKKMLEYSLIHSVKYYIAIKVGWDISVQSYGVISRLHNSGFGGKVQIEIDKSIEIERTEVINVWGGGGEKGKRSYCLMHTEFLQKDEKSSENQL